MDRNISPYRRHPLDFIFAPRNVAVIGASESEGSVGRTILWNLISNPFGFRFSEAWRFEPVEPKIDLTEEEGSYVVKASIPGVKPEDVEVTLQHNILTIQGETTEDKEVKEEKYHMRERRYGTFMRSIMLPSEVKAEEIEAKNENGVLTVRLPKSEVVKPKKIAIQQ